jgi:hypothetical protein
VYNYFTAWEKTGVTQDVLDGLRDRVRLAEGRNAAPSGGSVDSASVKAAETVAKTSRGFDAGKKINGRKRHIAVDTLGLLICVLVTHAGVQDRTAAPLRRQGRVPRPAGRAPVLWSCVPWVETNPPAKSPFAPWTPI